jgi:beta-glucuronidase
MIRRLLLLAPLLLLLVPASASAADKPERRTLYADGPVGRFLLGGEWLFRLDAADQGLKSRYMRSGSRAGWTPVKVPNAWNTGDHSEASMAGSVGWYRKDFELPDAAAALEWIVRFESANYRTRVWLNGRSLGAEHAGAYLPFELRLAGLKRRGTNRLVVRIDSRRRPTDFPPSGFNEEGQQRGGWWNYGGLLREVYLRRVDAVDWDDVGVEPKLGCATCDASVEVSATMRNLTSRARRVTVSGAFGSQKLALGTRTVPANSSTTFRDRVTVRDPKLWAPGSPSLYRVRLRSSVAGAGAGSYTLRTGIRESRVTPDGRLLLNGRQVNFRGFGYHEDTPSQGSAVDNEFREWLVSEAKAAGATLLRTHYPPHPKLHEIADREGVLLWSEIPFFSLRAEQIAKPSVRREGAELMARNVTVNRNHPSVFVWSVGNELSAKPGSSQADYLRRAADAARAIDPTRAIGYAVAGYPGAGCHAAYAPLDVIGINDYFGWYPGPSGSIFDRRRLSAYLDSVRACYPTKAIAVTEFGAEANREGPVEEKGTFAFQQDFINYHLNVFATKPWLSGASYWALNEFRVRPAWEGGNPRPQPPIHQKAVTRYEDRSRKPAWADIQRQYSATQQLAPAGR